MVRQTVVILPGLSRSLTRFRCVGYKKGDVAPSLLHRDPHLPFFATSVHPVRCGHHLSRTPVAVRGGLRW